MNTKDIEIGERLKTFRKHLKLSQEEFGNKINISQKSLSAIERGDRRLYAELIEKISKTYNLNPNWLILGKGDMFLEKPTE